MEGHAAEHPPATTPPPSPEDARGPHFLLYAIAALVALTGTAVLAIVLIATSGIGGGSDANEAQPASGFVFFEQIHASILVEPGSTGDNALDLLVARHDGADPGVTSLTVAVANPTDGTMLGDFQAEPEAGSPGAYSVPGVRIPTPGDWQFTVTIQTKDSGTETQSTLISIGEPSTT